MQRYFSPDKYRLSFGPNEDVVIFSKSAGSDENLWGAEINGKRGYIPKNLVREIKKIKQPSILVDTELSNALNNQQVPSKEDIVNPSKVKENFEVIDGTTVYMSTENSNIEENGKYSIETATETLDSPQVAIHESISILSENSSSDEDSSKTYGAQAENIVNSETTSDNLQIEKSITESNDVFKGTSNDQSSAEITNDSSNDTNTFSGTKEIIHDIKENTEPIELLNNQSQDQEYTGNSVDNDSSKQKDSSPTEELNLEVTKNKEFVESSDIKLNEILNTTKVEEKELEVTGDSIKTETESLISNFVSFFGSEGINADSSSEVNTDIVENLVSETESSELLNEVHDINALKSEESNEINNNTNEEELATVENSLDMNYNIKDEDTKNDKSPLDSKQTVELGTAEKNEVNYYENSFHMNSNVQDQPIANKDSVSDIEETVKVFSPEKIETNQNGESVDTNNIVTAKPLTNEEYLLVTEEAVKLNYPSKIETNQNENSLNVDSNIEDTPAVKEKSIFNVEETAESITLKNIEILHNKNYFGNLGKNLDVTTQKEISGTAEDNKESERNTPTNLPKNDILEDLVNNANAGADEQNQKINIFNTVESNPENVEVTSENMEEKASEGTPSVFSYFALNQDGENLNKEDSQELLNSEKLINPNDDQEYPSQSNYLNKGEEFISTSSIFTSVLITFFILFFHRNIACCSE